MYSLGATLLYLLTHRSPAELPQDTLRLDFRSAVDISESFAEWLEKILEPDIENRFNSADFALAKLFVIERKKYKRLLANISIVILLLGLITGINSYKWFFLSKLGFFPTKLCYSNVMDDFINQKGNINHIARQQRISILSCIVKTGNKQRIKQAINNLNHAGKEINYPDSINSNSHKTPFHYAIFGNKYDVIKLLLDNGADSNIANKYGRSPFYDAASRSHITVFKLLIDRGANVNTKDINGISLLFSASYWDDESKIRLLIKHGADVDALDKYGKTALFYSVANKNTNIAKLLIDNGADVNIKDSSQRTPLFGSAYNGNIRIVEILIDWNANINSIDVNQQTPLTLAVTQGNKEVVALLLKHNADANVRDDSGKTPLFYA